MKKLFFSTISLMITGALVSGCGQSQKPVAGDTQSKGEEAKKQFVIGVSMSAHDQYLKVVTDGMEKKAKELGVTLKAYNADGNIQTQLNDVDNLLTQKVDAIILNPVDRDGLDAAVDKIKQAKIPLVETVAFTKNNKYDVFVGSKEENAGRIQGEFIINKIGKKGKMVILHGPMGQSGEIGRYEGLKEALLSKYPDWQVLAEQPGDWSRDKGMKIMEDWLQRYKDIDVVAAQNDEMALGAIAAIEAAGKTEKIAVLGVDAQPDAVQAVIDGKMKMTILQDATKQGEEAVKVTQGLLKGEKFEQNHVIPSIEVNHDNAKDFLKK
ncbi:substrate-binding domain-containing protein [Paenibacillus alginolyticus]|uniref:substrate-binding domain-containing protein n=1 Tax=Paenibacillus alginolyticus TaxID=59839 RepID=UPI0003FBB598|nr:substrate-binding domain-containing protein [Paenibacillus alginolyticus]MCY9665803.1 substrate-binding domain-containing protein [Paenibacillus alginolyticus]